MSIVRPAPHADQVIRDRNGNKYTRPGGSQRNATVEPMSPIPTWVKSNGRICRPKFWLTRSEAFGAAFSAVYWVLYWTVTAMRNLLRQPPVEGVLAGHVLDFDDALAVAPHRAPHE